MSQKAFSVLAVVCIAVVALGVAVADADASPSGTYKDQLDGNGRDVYSQLESRFSELAEDPVAEAKFSFALKVPVILDPSDDADSYAESMVGDVLTAFYLTDPTPIWLWDLPTRDGVDVKISTTTGTVGDDEYKVLVSVSFSLSAPSEYGTPEQMKAAMKEVEEKIAEVGGETVQDKVRSINDILRGVKIESDSEGEVSNIHDALVDRRSSSAGVAAAFTALCAANGVDAMTVNGAVMKDVDGNTEEGFWNCIRYEGGWYAADATMNGSDHNNCLLAGTTTKISFGAAAVRCGSTHAADVGFWDGVSLSAPALSSSGIEWPEDQPSFLDKYGVYIFGAVVAAIIVAALLRAVRVGDV